MKTYGFDIFLANAASLMVWSFLVFSPTMIVAQEVIQLDTSTVHEQFEQMDNVQATVVVAKEAWQGKLVSLADVLEDQTGIQTRKFGGLGAYQTVSIRGQSGLRVVVCIDGTPLNSASGGAVDLGKIDLSRIEKIEVYKGFIPARFGVSSVGGLVNLISKTNEASSLYGDFTYGSFNTHLHALSYGHTFLKNVKSFSAVSYKYSDNNFEYYDRGGTEHNLSDDTVRTRENDYYSAGSVTQQLSFPIMGGITTAKVAYDLDTKGISGGETSQILKSKEKSDQGLIQVEYSRQWLALLSPDLTIGTVGRFKDIDLFLYKIDNLSIKDYTKTGTHYYFYSVYSSLQLMPLDWLLLFGRSEYQHESIEPYNEVGDKSNLSFDNTRLGWKRSLEASVFAGEHVEIQGRLLSEQVYDYSTNASNAYSENHSIGYSAGLLYSTIPLSGFEFKAFGNIGVNYRLPSLEEKFGAQRGVKSNSELQKEIAHEYEYGLRLIFKGSTLSGYTEAVLFSKKIDNWIAPLYSAGEIKYLNVGNVEIAGAEMSVSVDFMEHLKGVLNYTIQDSKNKTQSSAQLNKAVPNTPRHSLKNSIVLYSNNFSCTYDMSYVSNLYRETNNTPSWEIRAKVVQDVFMKARYSEAYSVQFSIEDIFAETVPEESVYDAYPYPGRKFSINITITK